MISSRHVARFLGDKASARVQMPITAVQNLQELRFPGLLQPSTDGYSGGQCRWSIDPPVGGFNAGDTLISLPEGFVTGAGGATIAAAVAPDYGSFFAPGIYEIELTWWMATAFTFTSAMSFSCLRAAAGATDLGLGLPAQVVKMPGQGTASAATHPRFKLLSWTPWKAFVSAFTALADTMTSSVSIVVQPVVLFDDAGNVP